MKEAFTKIKEAIANIHRVVKTNEDLEWNRAIYKCSTIVSEVEAEYGNPKTNADRIRSLSDKELAELTLQHDDEYGYFYCSDGTSYDDYGNGYDEALKHEIEWLKSPTTD